jgi:hypothetical protein
MTPFDKYISQDEVEVEEEVTCSCGCSDPIAQFRLTVYPSKHMTIDFDWPQDDGEMLKVLAVNFARIAAGKGAADLQRVLLKLSEDKPEKADGYGFIARVLEVESGEIAKKPKTMDSPAIRPLKTILFNLKSPGL